MSTVFLKILNMSIAASWLIAVVLLVRFLLKKAPKWISCVLWALVALRLVIPFSLESPLSLLPSRETITYKTTEDTKTVDQAKAAEPGASSVDPLTPSEGSEKPAPRTKIPVIDSGVKVIDNALNPVIERAYSSENKNAVPAASTPSNTAVPADPSAIETTQTPAASKADPLKTWSLIATIVWISGTAGLLIYALISYLSLRKKVSASIHVRDNIWAADGIKTPFILGIFKPMIYVPSSLQGEALDYVLAHEEAHLQRRDHLWKPLGYLLLAIYWFNPLCWLAYILLCRDIESACDEKAVRFMGYEEMAEYSQTLLNLSIQRHQIAACPVAFGEVNVKARIKSILNYKKPAFCVVLVALLACIAVAGCFLTDPKKETDPAASDTETNEPVTDPSKETTKEPAESVTVPVETDPDGKETVSPGEKGSAQDPETPEEARIVVLEEPEILFTIPVNQGDDSLRGVVLGPQDPTPDYDPSTENHYEFGPGAFALRNEEDVFILDNWNKRILHLRKGVETESLTLDALPDDIYGLLLVHEDDVYAVTYDGVLRWNYVTGETAFFKGELNPLQKDFYVENLVWQDGLVLVNPAGTNLKLDESTGTFTETKDGYRTERDTLGSKELVLKGFGKERIIPKEGFVDIVGKGPLDSVFVVSFIENEEGKYDDFLKLYGPVDKSYTQAPELLSIQLPTEMIWWLPGQAAYVGQDGVYVLLIEKDYAYVVKYISFEYGPEPYEAKAVDSARIDLDFTEVHQKGVPLSGDEYQRIQKFFARDYSQYPWNFLNQSFNDPSEIDLLLLFRDGTDTDLPEEECIAAWTAADLLDWRLGPQKRTKESVRELFMKYTGTEPTDKQMKAFSLWLYLSDYDAYYSFVTDAAEDLRVKELEIARRLSAKEAAELGLPVHEDGMIVMKWTGGQTDFSTDGMVILIPEGDSYRIAANLVLGTEAKADFKYEPGKATVELKTEGGTHFLNLDDETERNLEEYFRLRAFERADPLGAREAIETSSLFADSEIGEMFIRRSIRCMEQINAIQASFLQVDVICTIQSVREIGYELFIQCKEDYSVVYRYKDSEVGGHMQDGSEMMIVMERSHIVPIEYAKYSLTMAYGGVLDEPLDEETILQEYRAYREDHLVTNEMIGEAREQISEQLVKRLEKAVEEGTWGMEGYKKEDIPKLLVETRSYLSSGQNEEIALKTAMNGQRMPFRQYKAVFAMDYEMSVTDPATNKTMTPFGRYTRVFFLGYDNSLEYADVPEGGF